MNIEIVATKLQGTYACGSQDKPDTNVMRSGWASAPCDCDNALRFTNCGRQLAQHAGLGFSMVPASTSVPVDCTASTATAPSWFKACASDGGCMRVAISSSMPALVLTNSSMGSNATSGFNWCIDSTNFVVYAKIHGPPSGSVAFFEVNDDVSSGLCRFLTHHWIDGDLISVYEQNGLNCTLEWVQIPDTDGVTSGTLHVSSA
mmetsp:Transcript_19907/g.50647  ORF Transcript_19907/g.50647 Transcript_19907/m.50647 type:complete len:203 (+) Transcript_19907:808-1416(+)